MLTGARANKMAPTNMNGIEYMRMVDLVSSPNPKTIPQAAIRPTLDGLDKNSQPKAVIAKSQKAVTKSVCGDIDSIMPMGIVITNSPARAHASFLRDSKLSESRRKFQRLTQKSTKYVAS